MVDGRIDSGVQMVEWELKRVTDGQWDRCTDVSFALLPVPKVSEAVVIRKDCPAQKDSSLGP